jgi:hypothetical protein
LEYRLSDFVILLSRPWETGMLLLREKDTQRVHTPFILIIVIICAWQGKFKSSCVHFSVMEKYIILAVEGYIYHTIFQFFISCEEMFYVFAMWNGVERGHVSWAQNLCIFLNLYL